MSNEFIYLKLFSILDINGKIKNNYSNIHPIIIMLL